MVNDFLQIDAFSKLDEFVREDLMGRASGQPTPQRLKAILQGICANQGLLGLPISALFNDVVYIVLNHPPLEAQTQERHLVAAMSLNNVSPKTVEHLRGFSGKRLRPPQTFGCELLFLNPPTDSRLEKAALSLWHHKWNDYWRLTIDSERDRGWFTWNHLLLKGVRPVPIGISWQEPSPENNLASKDSRPPYLYLSPGLATRIGLPDPGSAMWFEQLLGPLGQTAPDRIIYPTHDLELYTLKEIFNYIDPNNHRRTTESVAWAVRELIQSYSCWGGKAFISIPVVIGALGFYRVAVLSLCTLRPLEALEFREWRSIAGSIFRPLIEEEMVNLARQRDLARVTYSIGHSLKSRYRGVSGKIKALCDTVAEKLPQDEKARAIASIAFQGSESCQRTGEMMNFMSALLYMANGSSLRQEFLSVEPYPLLSKLKDQCRACNDAQGRTTVELEKISITRLAKSKPELRHHPRGRMTGRLFDPFYDEIFFEILLNAAQHNLDGKKTCTVKVDLETGQFPEDGHTRCLALVFTNFCHDPNVLIEKGFAPGQWHNCRDGREGGLRFMADCLHIASVGAMHARVAKQRSVFVFQTRLSLLELSAEGIIR